MTLYPFDMQLAESSASPGNVAANAAVTFYDPTDTAKVTPLTLVDASGLPLTNPVTSSSQGFLPPFQATIPQVMWSGGGYTGYLNSYKGMRDAAVAAQTAATTSATAAATSNASALAAQVSAAAAAATAAGGGFALDPADADTLLITTKTDGTIVVDPSDADALLITT